MPREGNFVRILDWLLKGKAETKLGAPQNKPAPAHQATQQVAPTRNSGERATALSEAENLRRWRESGQARAWVESRQGQWGHAEWLALLEDLKRSPFWPMQPAAVGLVLEDEKRQWLQRN